MRQIILDTETTGLEHAQGHRIIEIGCVELIDRRLTGNHFHQYLQPDRAIDVGAIEIHGITNEFLEDKPRFRDVADEFLAFVDGAELVIHNAPFDVGFINSEYRLLKTDWAGIESSCQILDTLAMARKMHPGQRNSLDALCKRYDINNASRTLHGALLDSEILADVYLAMTGGQTLLSLDTQKETTSESRNVRRLAQRDRPKLSVISATEEELKAHQAYLDMMDTQFDQGALWRRLEGATEEVN